MPSKRTGARPALDTSRRRRRQWQCATAGQRVADTTAGGVQHYGQAQTTKNTMDAGLCSKCAVRISPLRSALDHRYHRRQPPWRNSEASAEADFQRWDGIPASLTCNDIRFCRSHHPRARLGVMPAHERGTPARGPLLNSRPLSLPGSARLSLPSNSRQPVWQQQRSTGMPRWL